MVNKKLSVKVVNNTKYFIPGKDKVFNSFPNNNCHYLQRLKIESFEARLYWQFRYCQSLGCPTFFYTLTYSNENVPYKYGTFCFDYLDLRDLFTGGFRKQLQRKYGLTFRYFVGAELGEGAGQRGLHNNPHYHILFFLEPCCNNFQVISPEDFRHLVRLYWQGFDQDFGFKDFKKSCKYGIAKEGDFCGLVKDFRAISYVSKYVTKDISLKMKEKDIISFCRFHYNKSLRDDFDFNRSFFDEVVKPLFFVAPFKSDSECFGVLLPELDYYSAFLGIDMFPEQLLPFHIKLVCNKHKLWKYYFDFLNEKVDLLVKEKLNEWRNRYCNKPRISQNVGVYAFDFIDDLTNPRILVPSKDGFKSRMLPLYFYRKLCKGTVKPYEITFNNRFVVQNDISVLNSVGVDLKVSNLETQVDRLVNKTKSNFDLVVNDRSLFDMVRSSDINVNSYITFDVLQIRMKQFSDAFADGSIFRIFAIYKLVYEDRLFDFSDGIMPSLDYKSDFRRFLEPSVFSVPWSDLRVDAFVDGSNTDYLFYSEHIDFHKYMGLFDLFDSLNSYFFICNDNFHEKDDLKKEKVRKFHMNLNLLTT